MVEKGGPHVGRGVQARASGCLQWQAGRQSQFNSQLVAQDEGCVAFVQPLSLLFLEVHGSQQERRSQHSRPKHSRGLDFNWRNIASAEMAPSRIDGISVIHRTQASSATSHLGDTSRLISLVCRQVLSVAWDRSLAMVRKTVHMPSMSGCNQRDCLGPAQRMF